MEYVDNASLTEIKSTLRPSEAMAVIDTIALVHAHSLKDTSWKDIPTVMWDDLMGENRSKHDIFQFIASIAKMDEERLQPLIKKFESIFEEVMDCDIGSKVLCSMNLQPVLCHGDLWINNLLWRKNGPTSRELAAIIDWQLVHGGCAAEDLARLFSSSLGPDDRRRHLDQLLQYYYTKLEDALGRAPPFSLHQVKESMFRLYPFLMTMALMSVGPLVTVKYKDLPRQEFEAIQRSLVDRAVALLEDIMYYHEKYGFLNK
ncbi:hypothetical protein AB6A40_009745 [Gnathostoma spinigerum]|uniref:CHK kinase-like domain-containing protein n=1 Tax=Gnathostoma spinigerum TaxID=75299 RepID=A0ABD6EZQ0_9BILA